MNSCNPMSDIQVAKLALAICATAETLGHALSADAAELMAEDLSGYSAAVVADALKACRRELTGKLTLAAILQRVSAADGRPGEDEAWALALKASDETESVVLTEEVMLALTAARPVLAAGDKVGARMAFKSAYARAVDASRRDGREAKWSLSMGYDPERRRIAVEEAAMLGRLSDQRVAECLAELPDVPVTGDGLAIAGLLAGPSNARLLRLTSDEDTRAALAADASSDAREASPEITKRLRQLRMDVAKSAQERERQRQAARDAQKEDLSLRKAAVAAVIAGREVSA